MNELVEQIGWLLFVAIAMVAVGYLTRGLILLTWDKGLEGKQVSSDDVIRSLIQGVVAAYKLLLQRILATVSSVAVLFLLLVQGVSGYVSLGYAAMTFVIAGLATPVVMRVIQPIAKQARAKREVSASSKADDSGNS